MSQFSYRGRNGYPPPINDTTDVVGELAVLEQRYKITTAEFVSIGAERRAHITAEDHAYWNALIRMGHK